MVSRSCLILLFVGLTVSAQTPADADKDKKTAAPPAKVTDVPLVERLMAARKEYQLTLESLRVHYVKTGDIERARMAEDELKEFHRINKQVYQLPLDVPPPTLLTLIRTRLSSGRPDG